MKLSPKQIAASAAGAMASAVIASLFGEKGTIIGVALGSVVATTLTTLVIQSIERTHDAVKQVVKVDHRPAVFRRFGGTEPAGAVASETAGSPVTEQASLPAADGATAVEGAAGTAAVIDALPDVGEAQAATSQVGPPTGTAGAPPVVLPAEAPPAGPAPAGTAERRLIASNRRPRVAGGSPVPVSASGRPVAAGGPVARAAGRTAGSGKGIRWPALALTVGVVFVVALVVVTGIELLAGKPLSSLLGSSPASGGTSAGSLFTPSPTTMPPATIEPSTTTSTTTVSGSSTTTTVSGSSTTTVPAASSTTTSSTTSTTSTTTTTTTIAPGSTASTTPTTSTVGTTAPSS